MSSDECVRIALLEKGLVQVQVRHDSFIKRMEGLERNQNEILSLLIKIKYTMYGGAIILVADNIGMMAMIKKLV